MTATAIRIQSTEAQLEAWLRDPLWRLSNLYRIKDQFGRDVQFKPNWAQRKLYDDLHYANVILKARQLGFTTFIQIMQLDACLFRPNTLAGTIAHTLDSAKDIFREKVRFPYESLPPEVREMVKAEQDSQDSLAFSNGSRLRVGTSLRSGTYQWLHVSELGYISAHYPEKAEEIRTGALNTVHPGQTILIESTAKGAVGLFYELSEEGLRLKREGAELGLMDYRHHFFPWWQHPGYTLDEPAPTGEKITTYFHGLEKHGIGLKDGQKAWYGKKLRDQKGSMKAEFPSTPEEAFEGAEGVYFDCFDRDLHVCKPFRVPDHWVRFRAEDWGTARPFCVQWWAVASESVRTPDGKIIPRGALVCYREWYGVAKDEAGRVIPNVGIKSTPQRVGKGIVTKEGGRDADGKPVAENISYHVADPAMWADVGGPSQAEQQHAAIRAESRLQGKSGSDAVWKRANNQRVKRGKAKGGWDMLRDRMLGEDFGDEYERPMIYWFGTCTDSIRTLPVLMHDENQPEDMDTEGEDHAADTSRYACMSRPYTRPKPTEAKPMTSLGDVSLNFLWKEHEVGLA